MCLPNDQRYERRIKTAFPTEGGIVSSLGKLLGVFEDDLHEVGMLRHQLVEHRRHIGGRRYEVICVADEISWFLLLEIDWLENVLVKLDGMAGRNGDRAHRIDDVYLARRRPSLFGGRDGRRQGGGVHQVEYAGADRTLRLIGYVIVRVTARDAADVHSEDPITLEGMRQDVVAFSLDGAPVRIYLNPCTHLPTAIDYSGALARTGYWQRLGDVTMRVSFSRWFIGQGGVRMPMQIDTDRNGLRESTYSLTAIDIGKPGTHTDLIVSSRDAASFAAMSDGVSGTTVPIASWSAAIEEAPGVTILPGSWNVTIVRQPDGIVIVEAPISSDYSEKVIAEAERRYLGIPIKAVVSTSDSWPHIAGLRPYVARGIPIYAPGLNRPIISSLVAAPYSSKPDRLQHSPRPLRFVSIEDGVALGAGTNRMALYPIRGETSERQAMVYWPDLHLLYGSDPFQTVEMSEEVLELRDAVRGHDLSPDRFYMMHIPPGPWRSVVDATSRLNLATFPMSRANADQWPFVDGSRAAVRRRN